MLPFLSALLPLRFDSFIIYIHFQGFRVYFYRCLPRGIYAIYTRIVQLKKTFDLRSHDFVIIATKFMWRVSTCQNYLPLAHQEKKT